MDLKTTKLTLLLALGWLLCLPSLARALDPCLLITKAEAEMIMGEEVKGPLPGKVTGFAAGDRCDYQTAAPLAQRGRVGTINLILFDPQTMAREGGVFRSPRKYFLKQRHALGKNAKNLKDLAELADQAFWLPGPDVLHLLAGDCYLQLQVKDMVEMKGASKTDLAQKLSAHRLKLSTRVAREHILPRLKTAKSRRLG